MTVPATAPSVELRPIPLDALRALLAGDLARAGDLVGATLPAFFATEGWLWELRLGQIEANPDSTRWYVRAAVTDAGLVVGHAGFHGPPDPDGMVEIGYTVDPDLRRRGWGRAIVDALLAEAAREPAVRMVRASVSPTNAASLALLLGAGFVQIGEQWDDKDGLELVFEQPVVRAGAWLG